MEPQSRERLFPQKKSNPAGRAKKESHPLWMVFLFLAPKRDENGAVVKEAPVEPQSRERAFSSEKVESRGARCRQNPHKALFHYPLLKVPPHLRLHADGGLGERHGVIADAVMGFKVEIALVAEGLEGIEEQLPVHGAREGRAVLIQVAVVIVHMQGLDAAAQHV